MKFLMAFISTHCAFAKTIQSLIPINIIAYLFNKVSDSFGSLNDVRPSLCESNI